MAPWPWTDPEIVMLRELDAQGYRPRHIAKLLDRSGSAVRTMLCRLRAGAASQ